MNSKNDCIKNIFFKYTIFLGCNPLTIIHKFKRRPHLISKKLIYFWLLFSFLVLCYNSSGVHGKGNRSILGVPDQLPDFATLSAFECTFLCSRHKTTHNNLVQNQENLKNGSADFLFFCFSDPNFPDRFIISLTHQAIKNDTHWPDVGNIVVCSTFKNVTLTHSLSSSRSLDTSQSFSPREILSKYAKPTFEN